MPRGDPLPRTPRKQDKYNWDAAVAAAMSEPGQWFMVSQSMPRSHANQIRAGRKAAFRCHGDKEDKNNQCPREHWRVATRGRGEWAELHIQYIGPTDD